jgi:hypothetical protein
LLLEILAPTYCISPYTIKAYIIWNWKLLGMSSLHLVYNK